MRNRSRRSGRCQRAGKFRRNAFSSQAHPGSMFPRIRNGRVLECDARARAYALVRARPGVTIGDISRELGIDFRTAEYHLRVLQKLHFVEELRVGSRRHFFQNGGTYSRDRQLELALLRAHARRRVLARLRRGRGMSLRELARSLGMSRGTVQHHVIRLRRAGLLACSRRARGSRVALDKPPPPGGSRSEPTLAASRESPGTSPRARAVGAREGVET